MQILVVTLGSIGDLMPFLVVADRLRTNGHRCIIASNAGYAQLVQAMGFPFAVVWERQAQSLDDTLTQDPAQAWQEVRREMFLPAREPTLRCITHLAQKEPTVVLASWSAFGARAAHEQLGVPLVSAYLSPFATSLPDAQDDPGVRVGFFADWFAPAAARTRNAGFPMFAPERAAPLPADLASFLDEGTPPVILTPGSFMRHRAGFFRSALAACEQLGRRAVVLTPYQDQVPALPSWARHYSYIALERLLPRAAAIIHHGGIGTAAQAMRAGTPQLAAPVFFDQFDNAARLEALGAGRKIDGQAGAAEIVENLEAMLSAPASAACAALRARFSDDAAAHACAIVEQSA